MNKGMKTSGAEATIFLNEEGHIEKSRIKKDYRLPQIDEMLRASRTRREARVMKKLHSIIPVPRILKVTDHDIIMENIDGEQVKRLLDSNPSLAIAIGKNLALIHDANIIHGDLTTSNIILKGDLLYFIDFGLSFTSTRIEDKAVDIHLFRQALESRHYSVAQKAYEEFLKGYDPKDKDEILKRLHVVEQRGRYKEKS